MIATMATLVVGVLIGYLGQRSRFCIISGIRDFFMLKDFHRLKGLFGLIIGAVLTFSMIKLAGVDVPSFPMPIQFDTAGYMIATIIGGLGLGFFSVLAEGCPFRQHVMASEGSKSAIFYLFGFYIGILYFNVITLKLLDVLLSIGSG